MNHPKLGVDMTAYPLFFQWGIPVGLLPQGRVEIRGVATDPRTGAPVHFHLETQAGPRHQLRLRMSEEDARALMEDIQLRLIQAEKSVDSGQVLENRPKVDEGYVERQPAQTGVPEEQPTQLPREPLETPLREQLVENAVPVEVGQQSGRKDSGKCGCHRRSEGGELGDEVVDRPGVKIVVDVDEQTGSLRIQVHVAPLAIPVNQLAGAHRRAPRFYPAGPGGTTPTAREGRNG